MMDALTQFCLFVVVILMSIFISHLLYKLSNDSKVHIQINKIVWCHQVFAFVIDKLIWPEGKLALSNHTNNTN